MTAVVARPPLRRPRDVLLGGVSAAVARHLGRPVATVRLVFVGLSLLAGGGALLYLWLWAFVPRQRDAPDVPATRVVPVAASLLGVALAVALPLPFTWGLPTLLPWGAVESALLAVTAVAWTLAVDPRDPRHRSSAPLVRVLAAVLLALVGVALFPGTIIDGRPVVAVLCAVLILLGAAALVVPVILVRVRTRGAERAALAREEQRSEIAAHLHDSVLQTLAIIQSRAGAGSEVARIARAQERELRDWLFAGTDPFAGDLATELRTIARELELEHAVRIEVVTVGDVGEVESPALAGAAREALVNAARHAGGDVTVYAEATPEVIEVFVRDRGAGFDPESIPAGRLGIRESIVGRMARAGGSAVLASGTEGTEVQLRLPRRPTASPAGPQGAP